MEDRNWLRMHEQVEKLPALTGGGGEGKEWGGVGVGREEQETNHNQTQ